MLNAPSPPTGSAAIAWRQIERLIEQTSAASHLPAEPHAFYGNLLDGALSALAAAGGAVWLVDQTREWVREVERNGPPAAAKDAFHACERQCVEDVASLGKPRVFLPSESTASGMAGCDLQVFMCPVCVGDACVAVLELFQPPDFPAESRANVIEVLQALAEAAADFHRAFELHLLRRESSQRDRLDAFANAVQRDLDVAAVAFTIANDGRELIGCDRVWVLAAAANSCRTLAVTGCDRVDRAAESVRAMERLAAAVAIGGEPIWVTDRAADLPPTIESRLNDYLDAANSRQIALVPIAPIVADGEKREACEPFAIVAAESFARTNLPAAEFERQLRAVCLRCGAALDHALELQNIPGVSMLRRWARSRTPASRRRQNRWRWIVAGVAGLVAGLSLIPANFSVGGRGTLQPKVRRHVFAPRNAIVDQVFVAEGERVGAGHPLFQLRDPDLDFEHARVVGEIQTTEEQLRRVRAERLRGNAGPTNSPDGERLAGDEETLGKHLAGLRQQRQLLTGERDALRLCSPIDGHVLTWDVANQWQDRPVRQGQRLAEIADTSDEWILELDVTDRDARHAIAARDSNLDGLTVNFLLATDTRTVYEGRVESIALAAESRNGDAPSVRVTVRMLNVGADARKAGASVVARIQCGRRALGYVWLHDTIDVVRKYLWL